MPRSDLDIHFDRIEKLVQEMHEFVPPSNTKASQFRADLAGLLVVTIAASYESCVKETLVNYASSHHIAFGSFATNNYKKLNSKININDLHVYTKLFDEKISNNFINILSKKKNDISNRLGKNIESSYKQILNWRHDFAHAGIRNTTIEEALSTHRFAKRVLYAFDDAFHKP